MRLWAKDGFRLPRWISNHVEAVVCLDVPYKVALSPSLDFKSR